MPATITVTTDKAVYTEGEPIIVTVTTTQPDADKVGRYRVFASWTIDGSVQQAEAFIDVNFGAPETSAPSVGVSAPSGFPGISLVQDATDPNVFTGVIPTD